MNLIAKLKDRMAKNITLKVFEDYDFGNEPKPEPVEVYENQFRTENEAINFAAKLPSVQQGLYYHFTIEKTPAE